MNVRGKSVKRSTGRGGKKRWERAEARKKRHRFSPEKSIIVCEAEGQDIAMRRRGQSAERFPECRMLVE